MPPSDTCAAPVTDRPTLGSRLGAAISTRRLDVDPLVAYHALGHYLTHPEDRSELSSDAAVSRVREGRLSGPDEPAG